MLGNEPATQSRHTVTAQSQHSHSTVAAQSHTCSEHVSTLRPERCNTPCLKHPAKERTPSECKHPSVTAQSQHSHSTVSHTASGTPSECKHPSVTAQSQRSQSHSIGHTIGVQAPIRHSTVIAQSQHSHSTVSHTASDTPSDTPSECKHPSSLHTTEKNCEMRAKWGLK